MLKQIKPYIFRKKKCPCKILEEKKTNVHITDLNHWKIVALMVIARDFDLRFSVHLFIRHLFIMGN